MTHAELIKAHREVEADCEPNLRTQALNVAARILPPDATDSQLKLAAACYLRGQSDAFLQAGKFVDAIPVEFPIGKFVP